MQHAKLAINRSLDIKNHLPTVEYRWAHAAIQHLINGQAGQLIPNNQTLVAATVIADTIPKGLPTTLEGYAMLALKYAITALKVAVDGDLQESARQATLTKAAVHMRGLYAHK